MISVPMGVIDLLTLSPLGAHEATSLQDLYTELHTHTHTLPNTLSSIMCNLELNF
jgi:hypothetical protein